MGVLEDVQGPVGFGLAQCESHLDRGGANFPAVGGLATHCAKISQLT